MVWNPLHKPAEVEHVMEGSEGTARVWGQSWSGAQRLAYEDLMSTRAMDAGDELDDDDPASDGKGRSKAKISFGTLRVIHATITLTRAEGFPPVQVWDTGAGKAYGERPAGECVLVGSELFDPKREDHLGALGAAEYEELLAFATKVQSMAGDKKPAKSAEVGSGAVIDGEVVGDAPGEAFAAGS